MSMSDKKKSISSFSDQDGVKFEKIYTDNFAVLYMHALKMLGNPEEATDVVQDVFTVAWQRRNEIVIHSSFKAYLFRAVKNKVLDIYAHQAAIRKFQTTLDMDISTSPQDDAAREQELMQLIEQEVSQLPEQMRVVFNMSRMEEKSNAEIAETLDISVNTVKTHIGRALKKLRVKFMLLFL